MKDTLRLKAVALRIGSGYLRAFRGLGIFLAGLAVIGILGALIVTPLWYLATSHVKAYSLLVIAGAGGAAAATVIYRGITDRSRRKRYLRTARRILFVLIAAAVLYMILLLFSWGIPAAAAPLAVVYVLAIGLVLHGKKKNR